MADLKIKIGAVTTGLRRGLASGSAHIKSFGRSTAQSLKSSFGAITALAGAFIGLAAGAIKATAAYEQTAVAFKTMMGNAQASKKLLSELTEFSTKTPFEPAELFKAAKTLLAFGIQADDVLETIKMLGDISSATGKDLNELGRIYGKVFVKGKMQAEELNQLSEAGIPIIKELQKQTGKNAEEIFKMGSAGKLSFTDLENGFKNMTTAGGMFFNSMAAQSETFNGKISTLRGNWDLFKQSLGDTSLSKKGLDFLNYALKEYTDFINRFKTGSTTDDNTNIKTGRNIGLATFGQALVETIGLEDVLGTGNMLTGRGAVTQKDKDEMRKKNAADIKAASDARAEAARRKEEKRLALETQLGVNAGMGLKAADSMLSIGGHLAARTGGISTAELTELQKQTELLRNLNDNIRVSDLNASEMEFLGDVQRFIDGA